MGTTTVGQETTASARSPPVSAPTARGTNTPRTDKPSTDKLKGTTR